VLHRRTAAGRRGTAAFQISSTSSMGAKLSEYYSDFRSDHLLIRVIL
jgi:hypothetical protein